MTAKEAMNFIEKHGVVLVSAKGAVPRLTEAIAGESIKGSWWGHPKGHQIYAILQVVTESEDILVCRLIEGKITLVHRRLWPALVRVAKRFPADRITQVRQEHTASGHHMNREVPFPKWVPSAVREQAREMNDQEALIALGSWTQTNQPSLKRNRKR